MGDQTGVALDGAPAEETDPQRAEEGTSAKSLIAVIESRAPLREWIRHSVQSASSLPVILYSSVSELEAQLGQASPRLVIFSLTESNEASVSALKVLLELVPAAPVIVLAPVDDVDLARTVVRLGAKSYIPATQEFCIESTAIRFALTDAAPFSRKAGRQAGGVSLT